MSVVKNVLVRFNCRGYHLGSVVRYMVEEGQDQVLVQVSTRPAAAPARTACCSTRRLGIAAGMHGSP